VPLYRSRIPITCVGRKELEIGDLSLRNHYMLVESETPLEDANDDKEHLHRKSGQAQNVRKNRSQQPLCNHKDVVPTIDRIAQVVSTEELE
jgi:hypothetical protein